ncbi:hypothetical protein [Haladaptatus sp. DYF46]|uniref:hypothetical protein n=1 Tax=Haladaptatus sp. DYF46 TaxID=2886041 RepID=UPI001E5A06A4|nr:hypothetical protein [Haladaptatus sp. DYF46]
MTDELSKTEMQRRRVLKTIGAGALANGLAGCSSLSTGDEAEAVTSEATGGSPSKTTADGTTPGTETDAPSGGKRVAFGDCTGVLPEESDPQRLEADIDQNTTLGDDCGRYVVSGTVDVTGATLTVKSGTELVFEQNAGLKIATDATLVAKGTCKRPVLFTGAQETRGFWRGIYFEDSNKPNEMTYCVVEYAGGGDEFWQADVEANLAVGGNSRIAASNCAFRESGAWGFTFGSEVHVDDFSKNAVTANAAGAGFVRDASAHHVDGSGTYTGNDDDVVHIWGHDGLGDGFDETWSALDARYRVSKLVELGTDAHLTIAPGTTLSFEQEAGLKVSDSSQLTAAGIDPETEESKPITFTGEQKTRGFWRGLYFETSDRVPSVIENCVIEYGGGREYWSADANANVVVGDGARARITNTTLRESGGYGFNFAEEVTIDAFVNNTVTRNANGAGYVRDDRAHFLSDTGTYAGNDTDRVYVWQHDDIGTDLDVTWDAIDVPYFVDTGAINTYGNLTIEPGATVEFGQEAGLKLLDGGTLTAVGIDPDTEVSKPITFTGEQKTRGYWRGIYFESTDRTENQLRNCVVEYGGGGREYWNADANANVAVSDGSRARIDGCTIRESGAWGFNFADDVSVDSFTTNTVTRNVEGAGYVRDDTAHFLSDTGTYVGNDEDRVYVWQHDDIRESMDVTWDALDAPYFVDTGAVSVYGNLTIEPGATLEFGQDAGLRMYDGGSLTAVGTESDPITFTGEQKTRGYWRGIYFENTNRTENKLHYCIVEYAGGGNEFWNAKEHANVAVTNGSRLSIQHSTIRNSAGYGYEVTADSTLTASANSVVDNALGPKINT